MPARASCWESMPNRNASGTDTSRTEVISWLERMNSPVISA